MSRQLTRGRKRAASFSDVRQYDDGEGGGAQGTSYLAEDHGYGGEEDMAEQSSAQITMLARKLVRYSLSSEYARRPIRRQEINQKVLGAQTRMFRRVFAEAQAMLQTTFGTQLVELARQEKATTAHRRAQAQRDKAGPTSTNSWVLVSTLERKYRTRDIIQPPQVPTQETESTYVGLYSFIVALLYLSGGTVSEQQLDKHLRRMNAEQNTPLDKTEALLKRMIADNYLYRSRDSTSGEEVVEYHIGPRARLEIGEKGVAELVRSVYGGSDAPMDEDLERRLDRTLALAVRPSQAIPGQPPNRGQRSRRADDEDNLDHVS